jgi:hypothetical protein
MIIVVVYALLIMASNIHQVNAAAISPGAGIPKAASKSLPM